MNCVPAFDLKVAAGGFSPEQIVEDGPGTFGWVAFEGDVKPAKDIFVAQVVGESMNEVIPSGSWCVWRLNPGCDGKSGTEIVLAQHRDIQDPETDAKYTVKLYKREVEPVEDGEPVGTRVVLSPSSKDPAFRPIVIEHLVPGELEIIAEFVKVLGGV